MLTASVENLRKATTMKADEPSYHNNLGLSQFELQLFQDALGSYEQAIKYE